MPATFQTIPRSDWEPRARRHQARLEEIVNAHLRRRAEGRKHPIVDFLFEYYGFRPSHLLAWTPGVGVVIEDADRAFSGSKYAETRPGGSALSTASLSDRLRTSTRWIRDWLVQTQSRPPQYGCAGLHEWAMVYKAEHIRHPVLGFRLPQAAIDQVVESGPLVCTHYDAFRFFTPSAGPQNRHQLTAARSEGTEQPGCLHANMDLYRWAMKRHPFIPSEIVADAFLLAMEIREVDMQASPYDVSAFGLEPILVETPEGRRQYRQLQEGFFERARPLRSRLIAAYDNLLAHMDRQVIPAHVERQQDGQ